MIIFRSIHIAANGIISFVFVTVKCFIVYVCVYIYIYIYTHHIFIHSSVYGHLGCFCVLTVVNSAAMNIGVHESF